MDPAGIEPASRPFQGRANPSQLEIQGEGSRPDACSADRLASATAKHGPKFVLGNPQSGWRGSNPRPLPWQGSALPLSHNRLAHSHPRERALETRSFASSELPGEPQADRVGVEPTSSGFRAQARDQPTLRPSVPLSREREGRNPMYRILHTACAAVAAGRSDAPASGAGIEPANAGVKAPLPRHQSIRNRVLAEQFDRARRHTRPDNLCSAFRRRALAAFCLGSSRQRGGPSSQEQESNLRIILTGDALCH